MFIKNSVCGIRKEIRQTGGFTLIELLVVMSIIGILAGMLFPAISMIKKSGRKAQCANNLRQLGMSVVQYAQGNNGALPGSIGLNSWDSVIVNFETPSAVMKFPILRCPEEKTRDITQRPRSYVLPRISGTNGFMSGSGSGSRLLMEATVPGATILLTEYWTTPSGTVTPFTVQGDYGTSVNTGYTTSANIPTHPDGSKSYYHGSAINFLMADGRLQALNPKLVATSTPAANTDPHWQVIR